MWYCRYHLTGDTEGVDVSAIKKQQRILVINEKTLYLKKMSAKFAQYVNEHYDIVISPYEISGYEGRWIRLPCLMWHYGIETKEPKRHVMLCAQPHQPTSHAIWARILSSKRQQKTRILSVFCSGKLKAGRHKQRRQFVEALKDAMGDDVHVYGHGYDDKEKRQRFIANKADGLDPYRYTIALENQTIPHFWSEKIPDAYLGEAYPFYYGCANLGDYFPAQAFTPIDIFDIEGSIKTIKDVCHSPLWEERYPYILEAKRRVIEDYHLKNILRRIIEGDESLYEKTGV